MTVVVEAVNLGMDSVVVLLSYHTSGLSDENRSEYKRGQIRVDNHLPATHTPSADRVHSTLPQTTV